MSIHSNNSVVVNQLSPTRKVLVSNLRLLNNVRVDPKLLIAGLTAHTGVVTAGRHVIAISDTTDFNFSHHAGKIKEGELGPVGNKHGLGFNMHLTLVLDRPSSMPFGIGDLKTWIRPVDAPRSDEKRIRKMPIEEKESYRWIGSAEATKDNLPDAEHILIIADRECDIYQFMQRIPNERTDILVRASYDRKLDGEGYLFSHLDSLAPQLTYEFEAQQTQGRTAHTARMELRFCTVKLRKPDKRKNPDNRRVTINVVDARELPATVHQGQEPIHWRLYTTCKVETPQDALQIVQWYRQRWIIEQFFRTLKSQGLNLEQSQLETGSALIKLAITASEVALKTLQLVAARDGSKEVDAKVVFTAVQLRIIAGMLPGYEGKTHKQKTPYKKETLAYAAWVIARMGGWKGYASEAPPGPITMRSGLEKLGNIEQAFRLIGGKDVCIV